jgi:hypothetical protein
VVVHLLDDGGALALAAQLTVLLALDHEDQSGSDKARQDVVKASHFRVHSMGGKPAVDQIDREAHSEARQQGDHETTRWHSLSPGRDWAGCQLDAAAGDPFE